MWLKQMSTNETLKIVEIIEQIYVVLAQHSRGTGSASAPTFESWKSISVG